MRWIEKQRNVIDFTLSSLMRRKGKNAALVVVYTLVVWVLASVMFFTQSIKREANLILQDAPEVMVQKLVAGRHDLIPLRYVDMIKEIRGVQSVQGRLWGYYYDPTNGANYTLMVREDLESDPGNIIIGKGVSRSGTGKEHGTMPFKAHDGSYLFLKIKEVLSSESGAGFQTAFWDPGGICDRFDPSGSERQGVDHDCSEGRPDPS